MLFVHWIHKPGSDSRSVSDGPFESVQLTYDSLRIPEYGDCKFDDQFLGKRTPDGWARTAGDRYDDIYSDLVINESEF